MRRRMMLVLVLVLVLVMGLLEAPAAAKKPEPVGDRINVLFGTPTTFDADEPFHVMHGFLIEHKAKGVYDVDLTVDGVAVDEDFKIKQKAANKATEVWWVFNFPSGLDSGLYTFVVEWYLPCSASGLSLCLRPNARTLCATAELTVDFEGGAE